MGTYSNLCSFNAVDIPWVLFYTKKETMLKKFNFYIYISIYPNPINENMFKFRKILTDFEHVLAAGNSLGNKSK